MRVWELTSTFNNILIAVQFNEIILTINYQQLPVFHLYAVVCTCAFALVSTDIHTAVNWQYYTAQIYDTQLLLGSQNPPFVTFFRCSKVHNSTITG